MKVFSFLILFVFAASVGAQAQTLTREFDSRIGAAVEIVNLYGRVQIEAAEENGEKVSVTATGQKAFSEEAVKTEAAAGRVRIRVEPDKSAPRIDLVVKVPLRARIKVETETGEVRIEGSVESAQVLTDTGTISTNVPLDAARYDFVWTRSRPRFLSDVELEAVKESSGGRFSLSGKLGETGKKKEKNAEQDETSDENSTGETSEETAEPKKTKAERTAEKSAEKRAEKAADRRVSLNFTTGRGIVLLNVNPSEVPSDLRERPLTEAAKAIIRSGDSLLSEAVRRASPKHFGEYARTLPPRKRTPELNARATGGNSLVAPVKRVFVKVADTGNRAVGGLRKEDFTVQESGTEREILAVEPIETPFNLVLLLDVSGSVDNYVNFIRKAARNFTNTMRPEDKISIVTFSEDVKQISTFTTDRARLSESLDTFDAGGATAFYDALAYTLVDTLRPFRGERTAIVILSDGDDNRSFLSFETLLGSIQESGALVYPLYVPSGLIAASATSAPDRTEDPLRSRYMGLTTRAEAEGARLAQISGGVYYPIRRLDDLQKAYEDIVLQLRTAYMVTFRSGLNEAADKSAPRLRVRVNRPGAFVNLGPVTSVPPGEAKKNAAREVSVNFGYKFVIKKEGFAPSFFIPAAYGAGNYALEKSKNENLIRRAGETSIPNPESQIPNRPQTPEITGEITDITYQPLLDSDLQVLDAANFDINNAPSAFVLKSGAEKIAVSRWVSPKRTRSYPYERVYNTLGHRKRATVIPVLKDEGASGERDFLQFDTVSLLDLLDVYLILGYYADASRDSASELTDQKLDAAYVSSRLEAIKNFKGTAAEWNLRQMQNIRQILERAKTAYREISQKTGVRLHDERGVDNFAERIGKSVEEFRLFSRQKSQQAQSREFQTLQPKESLSSDTKARVTITDEQGGRYFFTCDETLYENKTIYLVEAKHSSRAKMPAASDIKDGLLKMMLYSNLRNVRVGNEAAASRAVLRLTSGRLEGKISSAANAEAVEGFLNLNGFTNNQKAFVAKLFEEARTNRFEIRLERGETAK